MDKSEEPGHNKCPGKSTTRLAVGNAKDPALEKTA